MREVWVVHYQEPIELGPNPGPQVVRKYRAGTVGFAVKMDAVAFLRDIADRPWFDPSVCYLEGPIKIMR